MTKSDDAVLQAARFIKASLNQRPEIALILGSGLGELAESVRNPVVFDTSDIPHFPSSTVTGHPGRLIFGTLSTRKVVVVQGRLHLYEGHPISSVVFPIRLVHALGARSLFVTNAAGGINRQYKPGSLMWITDHINWTWTKPSVSRREEQKVSDSELAGRVRKNVSLYDMEWLQRVRAETLALGIGTKEGTYLWTRGPSYETKAEIEAFKRLGADAVGMSTVPEVIQAHELGMHVLGLSTITNMATGLSSDLLSHDEVLEVARRVQSDLEKLCRPVVDCAPRI